GIVVEFQGLGFEVLKTPVTVGEVEYQRRVVRVVYRPRRLYLHGSSKNPDRRHFCNRDEYAAVYLLVASVVVIGPLSSVHELLDAQFHVLENTLFRSLYAACI